MCVMLFPGVDLMFGTSNVQILTFGRVQLSWRGLLVMLAEEGNFIKEHLVYLGCWIRHRSCCHIRQRQFNRMCFLFQIIYIHYCAHTTWLHFKPLVQLPIITASTTTLSPGKAFSYWVHAKQECHPLRFQHPHPHPGKRLQIKAIFATKTHGICLRTMLMIWLLL